MPTIKINLCASFLITVLYLFTLAINGQSITYTRWGRTTCQPNATLVYTGIMSSGNSAHTGSGRNLLCVHNNPATSERLGDAWQTNTAWTYGVEFDFGGTSQNNRPFSYQNNGGNNLNDNNPPCVVCQRNDKSAQVMIPGKAQCESVGMTTEYEGFLVASAHNASHQTDFICMDESPEVITRVTKSQ